MLPDADDQAIVSRVRFHQALKEQCGAAIGVPREDDYRKIWSRKELVQVAAPDSD
jgi:hypothetical protein